MIDDSGAERDCLDDRLSGAGGRRYLQPERETEATVLSQRFPSG
jgi:hypothetical protein